MSYYVQLKYDECWLMPGFSNLLVQRQEEREAGGRKGKEQQGNEPADLICIPYHPIHSSSFTSLLLP